MKRILALVGIFAALGSCTSSQEETWIGRNAHVVVDSFSDDVVEPAAAQR